VVIEVGGKETVLVPMLATMIKKKANKIFVPSLFISPKISRMIRIPHRKESLDPKAINGKRNNSK